MYYTDTFHQIGLLLLFDYLETNKKKLTLNGIYHYFHYYISYSKHLNILHKTLYKLVINSQNKQYQLNNNLRLVYSHSNCIFAAFYLKKKTDHTSDPPFSTFSSLYLHFNQHPRLFQDTAVQELYLFS